MYVKEPEGYYGSINESMWGTYPSWESWTWPGYEGKSIEIEVITKFPAVRLYVNGSEYDTKKVTYDTRYKAVFSVPYEAGWSAEVNGQPAEIRQVNVGFMAVLCPAGENITIRFTYETPGLRVGASISAAGLLLLAVYLLCAIRPNRRIRDSRMNRLPEDRADRLPATEAAGEQPPAVPDALTPAPAPSDDGFDLYAIYRPAGSDGQPAPEKTETGTEEEPK